jgi:hypothetical protein
MLDSGFIVDRVIALVLKGNVGHEIGKLHVGV